MTPLETACRAAAWPAWAGRPAGWGDVQRSGYALLLAGAFGVEPAPGIGVAAALFGIALVWAEPVASLLRGLR